MCASYNFLPERIRLPTLPPAAFAGILLERSTNSWQVFDTGVRADAGLTPEEAGQVQPPPFWTGRELRGAPGAFSSPAPQATKTYSKHTPCASHQLHWNLMNNLENYPFPNEPNKVRLMARPPLRPLCEAEKTPAALTTAPHFPRPGLGRTQWTKGFSWS